jgi:hypothetical protein
VNFVHDDPEFDALILIVSGQRGLLPGLIEKDYWATHALWALHNAGFEVWFKGGTSLSKGFHLIERFSEDLDLKVGPGSVPSLPRVDNWTGDGTRQIAIRKDYFEKLAGLLVVHGAEIEVDYEHADKRWRNANLLVRYPCKHSEDLAGGMKPYVLLEVGDARVTPYVERDITSFVHEHLDNIAQIGNYRDNRPQHVRCVHPLVTLIEKLLAISGKFPKEQADAAQFVRHYEDAAHIIAALPEIAPPEGYATARALAEEMLWGRKPGALPSMSDPAFTPGISARWSSIRRAHAAIQHMFWGRRISLEEACAAIREWIGAALP